MHRPLTMPPMIDDSILRPRCLCIQMSTLMRHVLSFPMMVRMSYPTSAMQHAPTPGVRHSACLHAQHRPSPITWRLPHIVSVCSTRSLVYLVDVDHKLQGVPSSSYDQRPQSSSTVSKDGLSPHKSLNIQLRLQQSIINYLLTLSHR